MHPSVLVSISLFERENQPCLRGQAHTTSRDEIQPAEQTTDQFFFQWSVRCVDSRCSAGVVLREAKVSRGAVMRVFRDRRDDSDRSLRLGWAIFVWLMTRQLVSLSDVDLVQVEQVEEMKVVDLFAGLGGFSAGALAAGAEAILGVDRGPVPLKLWSVNVPGGRAVLTSLGPSGNAVSLLPPPSPHLHLHASTPCTDLRPARAALAG